MLTLPMAICHKSSKVTKLDRVLLKFVRFFQ